MRRMATCSLLVCLLAGCGGRESESDPDGTGAGGSGGAGGSAGVGGSGEFEPFFNGVDLSEFQLVGVPASELSVVDGVIECACQTYGYLYTSQTYENFVLALEFRF